MFEGRRKVPKDLPLVPEIPERLKRADAEYVTERRVIPVKPRIAPERPRGGVQTKKSSDSGDDGEEDERNSAEKNNKPSPKVFSASSSSESSNAPTLKAEREEPHEHDEDEHETLVKQRQRRNGRVRYDHFEHRDELAVLLAIGPETYKYANRLQRPDPQRQRPDGTQSTALQQF